MDGVVDEPFELLLCRGGILGALREVAGGGAEAGGQVVELGYERAEALGEALEIARHGAGGAARGRARCGLLETVRELDLAGEGVGELLQAPAMPLDRLLCLGKAGREVAHLRIGRIEGAVDGVLYITHAREAPAMAVSHAVPAPASASETSPTPAAASPRAPAASSAGAPAAPSASPPPATSAPVEERSSA